MLVGWDTLEIPTYRHEPLRAVPVRSRVRGSLLEQLALMPALTRGARLRCRQRRRATRPTTSSPPPRRRGRGDVLVATSDRDAYQLVSDRVTILAAGAGRERDHAHRAGGGARALRRRAGAGAGPDRAPRRPLRQAARAPAASGRRRRRSCSASTGRSRTCSPPGASPRRRRICASSVESRKWTLLPPFLPSSPRHLPGRRRPPSSAISASSSWPSV